jgi:UDPglucose 6-dehydrogenase
MKKLSVFGLGKVGLTMAACLAHSGHQVIGVEVDPGRAAALNRRTLASAEPGVAARIAGVPAERLRATTDVAEAVRESDVSFLIVPTPSNTLGGFSNRFVLEACEQIGAAIRLKDGEHTVSVVSTMLPGSSNASIIPALERSSGRRIGAGLGYCYNPSFIALGEVVQGFERPAYVLLGEADRRSGDAVLAAYYPMMSESVPVARMTPVEAEIAKIASNTHETMRVAFANVIFSICSDIPGANVDRVTEALTHRLGRQFFRGAVPYGGPCWPRDNRALAAFMNAVGIPDQMPRMVDRCNEEHGRFVLSRVLEAAAPGSRVGLIGLAYKPGTPVIERSFAIDLAGWLVAEGRTVTVWDPLAMDETRTVLADRVRYAGSAEACLAGSDVVVLVNALREYPAIDWTAAGAATVIDCWRALPEPARRQVGRYQPLGQAADGDVAEWLGRKAGRQFDLLTN